MKRNGVIVAAVGVIALTACSSTADSHSTGMPHGTGIPTLSSTTGQLTVNQADVMFVQMMIPHHEQAVEMADLAAANSTDPEVLALAAGIKAAQQPEIDLMRGWLAEWNASATEHSMGEDGMLNEAQMAELAAARAADFDQLFLTGMIAHHEGAIMMAQAVLASGTSEAVRTLAQQVVATQQAEVATMEKLLANL